eukprot:TRINITY_DN12227_c0_g1_i2.p2 TRINITY_DN12227_c0_g1~~TRINITY_DN12227_c0_g1_i2.p2  ORF type:complete len:141 (-),score=20.39 TRINITY_DN12227_c0_g1_i2:172-594(-)
MVIDLDKSSRYFGMEINWKKCRAMDLNTDIKDPMNLVPGGDGCSGCEPMQADVVLLKERVAKLMQQVAALTSTEPEKNASQPGRRMNLWPLPPAPRYSLLALNIGVCKALLLRVCMNCAPDCWPDWGRFSAVFITTWVWL